MNVAFILSGLPHYIVKLLNTINNNDKINVFSIIPISESKTLGSNVHTNENDNTFSIIKLKEYICWYKKPFFKQFFSTLIQNKIDVVVIGWPYFIHLVFNPILLYKLKKNNIKIICREIPFTVPYFFESQTQFSNKCVESQKNEKLFHSKFYFLFLKTLRKYIYSFVADFALTYTEIGVNILSSYGLPKTKITCTYNSPDTNSIFETISKIESNFKFVKNPYRLIHVGRLVKWKNVDLLIKAFHYLKSKNNQFELVIIGDGEEKEKLIELSKGLGLENQTVFLGSLYEGEEQSLEFLKSGIYVLAGMGGLSINEAMCHSLPIVCSVADGTEKHLVFENFNGAFFKDNNVESLVEAIERLCKNDLEKFGKNSLQIIKTKININTVSQLFVDSFFKVKS